jgi:hypothetical protein
MLEIERNTEETENSKKEGLREEDMTLKGRSKMWMSDCKRKEAQRIRINKMKGGMRKEEESGQSKNRHKLYWIRAASECTST